MRDIIPQIPKHASIVILTGAGISAESGLATFRASDGLWENHRIEDVATREAFARDPALVHTFYNMRRHALLNPAIQPNPAHLALARLEREWDGDVLVVTQNIDDLHERAGTKNLLHMHGEVLKMFCARCAGGDNEGAAKYAVTGDLDQAVACPDCGAHKHMRPDIVWFGEMPYHMPRIQSALAGCDVFISIGTSGNVYPAAGFVQEARFAGALTIEINLEPSNAASAFQHHFHGPAGVKVPEFVAALLGG
jgi:NAD-dependent deacetylase